MTDTNNEPDSDAKEEDEIEERYIMIIVAISIGFSAIIVVLVGLLLCMSRKTCCFKKKVSLALSDTELQHGNFEFRE